MPEVALPSTNAFRPYPAVWRQPETPGPLSGLRLAVKDLFDVAGYPIGAGNPFLLTRSSVTTETAPLVRRLLDAGASFAGKTKTDELAYSLIGLDCCFGNPVNPSHPDQIPGGSSSGSVAAVAAGLAEIGLGTDTSGSIRLPAAVNGLIGWRASHGLLSLEGCRPLAPSFDTAAFAVRNFDSLECVMTACGLGADMADVTPHFFIATDLLAVCEPEIAGVFLDHVAQSETGVQMDRIVGSPIEEALDAFNLILRYEAWTSNRALLDEHDAIQSLSIRRRLEAGREISLKDVLCAHGFRLRLREDILSRFPPETIFVFSTLPCAPPRIDAGEQTMDDFRNKAMSMLCVAGLVGGSQISVPACGGSISFLSALPVDRWLASAAKNFLSHLS